MGSTVSTGKLVAAFQSATGPMYVLFEETYESNCYPHTPRWSAMAICNLEGALRHIFRAASSCEGGMLKGAGGRDISPEGYVGGWMRALANPVEMGDMAIPLKVSTGYSAIIDQDLFGNVRENLVAAGHADLAAKLEAGETCTLSLHGDCIALAAIFNGVHAGAWRVIRTTPTYAPHVPELGYNPKKVKAPQQQLPAFMVEKQSLFCTLIQQADGTWRNGGGDYSLVGSFVANAWRTELSYPGSYRAQIKEYRAAIETAPAAPADMILEIDTTKIPSWQLRSLQGILKTHPHELTGDVVRMQLPTDSNQRYSVAHIESAVWIKPTAKAPIASPTEQLSMWAA